MTEPRAEKLVFLGRFLLAGGLNTAFGYGVFALLTAMGFASAWAVFVATALGMFFNFFSYGRLAFRALDWRRTPRFALAYGINYTGNVYFLELLRRHSSPYLVQLALLPFSVVFLYLAMRHFVFRPMNETH